MNLQDNTVLVTGASGGIGEEFAIQLAAQGVNLVLVTRQALTLCPGPTHGPGVVPV